MGYKSNLSHIQAVLSNPQAYQRSTTGDIYAIDPNIEDLLETRKILKAEMNRMVAAIEIL